MSHLQTQVENSLCCGAAAHPDRTHFKCAASHVDIMLSQAAAEQREKAEWGCLTIYS